METALQPAELKQVFRNNVKARRLELGLTQSELADKCGLHQPHIAAIERGTMAPTLDSIAKIATALNTTPGALMTSGIFSESA